MSGKKKRLKIFETKVFCWIIGLLLLLAFTAVSEYTDVFRRLDSSMLDTFFKNRYSRQNKDIEVGVTLEEFNPNISPDILIVGIDLKSLERLGKWPFPRWREADLLSSLARIQNQNERESSIFMDIFLTDPDNNTTHDGILNEAINENGRVFLETVLSQTPPSSTTYDDYFYRQELLYDNYGELTDIKGNWSEMMSFYGLEPPLAPYANSTYGYGHANFKEDNDGIYRRQALVAKSSKLIDSVKLNELEVDYPVDFNNYEQLVWTDNTGNKHNIEYPLTRQIIEKLKSDMEKDAPLKTVDTNNDGEPDEKYYIVEKYESSFVPSITLSLSCNYFGKTLNDLDITIGESIVIPSPQVFNVESGAWEKYTIITSPAEFDEEGNLTKEAVKRDIDEIRIPIDEDGTMLINYMGFPSFAAAGERQTYPIRSFSGYATTPPEAGGRLPRTKALGNKIVMVGAFTRGMADDEKPTPYGLMFGVEIHANALNTILMDKFLTDAPFWVDTLILAVAIFLVAFLSSRLPTLWSLLISLVLILSIFIGSSFIFDSHNYVISFPEPASAIVLTFLMIIAYRAMTEERDKRKIKGMFGTYLSPKVVEQMMDNPPELGGVDKDLTVFFSDIRGFTTLSESMEPQELVQLLNKYLTEMTNIIIETEGTLDKFEGDAIMAFWGAPLEQDDHALRACTAAIKQMEALKELNKTLPPEKQIDIGIGLNSGKMTVGNMGAAQRMDYTVMGDNVNLGARLEGTNKQYRTNIIMSDNTFGKVKDKVIARELDNIRVKGKNKPVLIYELIDIL